MKDWYWIVLQEGSTQSPSDSEMEGIFETSSCEDTTCKRC